MGKNEKLPVVSIVDAHGQTGEYIPFAERLPRFLEEYPPKDGWAVRHSATQAYPDRDPTFWVFRTTLETPEGRVLAEASALRRVVEYKDYEIGETASYQRLISYLGYPGDPEVWSFEEQDSRQPSMVPEETPASGVEAIPAPASAPEKTAEDVTTSEVNADFPGPDNTAQKPAVATPAPASVIESPKPEEPATASNAPSDVPKGYVRRIELLAKKKGVDVPPYSNFAEAKVVLAQLQK